MYKEYREAEPSTWLLGNAVYENISPQTFVHQGSIGTPCPKSSSYHEAEGVIGLAVLSLAAVLETTACLAIGLH